MSFALVECAWLAGVRRELGGAGVVISSQVDVDPTQRFGPWSAVLEAVRAGVATLDVAVAGTLLERTPSAADALAATLATSEAAAASAGRSGAADEAVVAAIQDAAALAERVVDGLLVTLGAVVDADEAAAAALAHRAGT